MCILDSFASRFEIRSCSWETCGARRQMLFMGILSLRCIARLEASPRCVAPTFWVALRCCLLFVGLSVQVSVRKPCNLLFKVVQHFLKKGCLRAGSH